MIHVIDLLDLKPSAVFEAISYLSKNLRKSDVEEIEASSGMNPEDALKESIAASTHCWLVFDRESNPAAIFGAAPYPLQGVGVVWMVGTDKVQTEAFGIARRTRPYVELMLQDYPMLWNYIDARNTVSKRWLKWAGFRLLRDHPEHGPKGLLFQTFARTAHV